MKEDLINQVWLSPAGLSRKRSREAVEAIFSEMKKALADHGNVIIRRFGEFSVRHKNARIGRNPQNGDPAVISERSVVRFKAGRELKEIVNHHG